jgi:hypothetical protein
MAMSNVDPRISSKQPHPSCPPQQPTNPVNIGNSEDADLELREAPDDG